MGRLVTSITNVTSSRGRQHDAIYVTQTNDGLHDLLRRLVQAVKVVCTVPVAIPREYMGGR